jgi:hypothetical protein
VPKSMRKVDGLNLNCIDFYVRAPTPRLSSTVTSLQLSEDITLFAACSIYTYRCHQQRDLDGYQAFGAYRLYIDCIMWGTGRNLETPMLAYALG